RVVAFYNKRGTCEQWIKEGKGAIKWTRLSCRTFAAQRGAAPASCARLQPRQFPAHAGDAGADQGLVADDPEGQADQIGAKVVSHGRYVVFQMAEVAIARQMFQEILRLIAELRPQPPPALA